MNPIGSAKARRLKGMGVDQWQLRPQPQPTLELRSPGNPIAWVAVDYEGVLQLDSDADAAATLLQKILAATGHPTADFAICQVGRPAPQAPTGVAQLWFTDRPIGDADRRLVLPSLGAMLEDENQKQIAWALLKPWRPNLTRS